MTKTGTYTDNKTTTLVFTLVSRQVRMPENKSIEEFVSDVVAIECNKAVVKTNCVFGVQ